MSQNLHIVDINSRGTLHFKPVDEHKEVDIRAVRSFSKYIDISINENQAYDIIDFLLKQYPSLKDNLT